MNATAKTPPRNLAMLHHSHQQTRPTTMTTKSTLTPADIEDNRRTLRLRKSSLVELKMEGIDRPSIKIAETLDEYKQAFNLTHETYVGSGYVKASPDHPYHYSAYSLLPETCLFVFKSYLTVIATLTEIFDSPALGLPMDELYKQELDSLRDRSRSVVELSSFVTSKSYRMRNIMVYLCKAMFNYSAMNNVDDICVMVNPKHVKFYTRMFLFEPFGQEKFYEKVQAPAVALRLDMDGIEERVREKYSRFEFTEDLHNFFYRTNTTLDMLLSGSISAKKTSTPEEIRDFFGP